MLTCDANTASVTSEIRALNRYRCRATGKIRNVGRATVVSD
jgi:hypothetical protein